jgi:hypothetical protein
MYGPGIPGSGLTGYTRIPRAEVVELVEPPEWIDEHKASGHDCAVCEKLDECPISEVVSAWQRGESVPRPTVEAAEEAGRVVMTRAAIRRIINGLLGEEVVR